MNAEEFKKYGQQVIEYIADYKENINQYPVMPHKDPGYLCKIIPENPPQEPESFEQVLADFEEHIMPGVAQWNHPQFHAYFPSGNAYCNVLADALNAAIGAICFSWYSCPAATELETIVLDWFARALDLPEGFMTDKSNFKGGGCFNGSASECTLVATFAARARAIKYLKGDNKHVHDSVYLPQLVAYASREAHSSVEKASMMALLQLRILEPDEFGRLQAQTVEDAIKADLEKGLTPCLVVATVGTTGMTAFDDLEGIGKAIEKLNLEPQIWFHVDGAYGGNSFILPEMRVFKKGLEYADSFNVNPNKLLLTAFDSSCLWARNVSQLKEGLIINPYYLQAEYDHERQIDYRHYGVSLSRRFRSLKLWFLFRTYGVSGLQKYVRNIMEHAKIFEELVRADSRFEVVNIVTVGLVTFRYREREGRSREEANRLTHLLLGLCNRSSIIHMIPNSFRKKDMIRFSVNYEHSTRADIEKSWGIILKFAEEIDREHTTVKKRRMPSRFTFTRSVSKEVYDRQSSIPNLTDGCTPILVMDTADIIGSLQRASLKNNIKPLNEEPYEEVSN